MSRITGNVSAIHSQFIRCPNADDKSKADRGRWYVETWAGIYLKDALIRLKPQLKGYDLSIEDVYALQQMCAYEVSLVNQYTVRLDSTLYTIDCCHRIL